MSTKDEVVATYLGAGDPSKRFTDYYPPWIGKLADDVVIEGSLMDGAVQGPEAVRTIIAVIRSLYEHQELNYAGPCGDYGWLEDYVVKVHGEPVGGVVIVTRNADGETERIVANYRPRSSIPRLSRLLGEKLAGTPYREHFAGGES